MAKEFKDFTFNNKSLSDLQTKYISVNFEDNPNISLAMERIAETGETNRYKVEPNYFYDKWSDGLSFEMNIIKDPCIYTSQTDMEITKNDIRDITRWLTSPHFPQWIQFKYSNNENDAIRYFGWFENIETWTVAGIVYGLKLYFKCSTPFGYTDDISNEMTVSTYNTLHINNNSDELENYCYPSIEIYPNANGQIYLCNLSDCKVIKNGVLTLTQVSYFDSLLDVIEDYAFLNGYTIEYSSLDDGAFNIVALCNDTAVQFKLVDKYNNSTKCTAFYLDDTKEYRIIEGGFLYMTVYRDLNVYMDCQKLTINDELGRMITYDKLGIRDVDQMYWPSLINGDNTLLLFGDYRFVIKHVESRKVGE